MISYKTEIFCNSDVYLELKSY